MRGDVSYFLTKKKVKDVCVCVKDMGLERILQQRKLNRVQIKCIA